MKNTSSDTVVPGLRAWLRSERLLGLPIVGIPVRKASATRATKPVVTPPAAKPAAAPPQRATAPARGRPVNAPEPPRTPAPAPAAALNLPPLNTRELTPAEAATALEALNEQFVQGCRHCRLCEGRTKTVFGDGNPRPDLVFVGEGPGADEDREGIPFIGRAGQLLTRMIERLGLDRKQVYIGNVVKCRPPGNRTPMEDEMLSCWPYLQRQLAILRPKVIVALGRPASQTLLATKTAISKLRGAFHVFPPPDLSEPGMPQCKLMPTFHPSYLLRCPGERVKTWEDMLQVLAELGLSAPASK